MRDLALFCWSHTSYRDLLPAFISRFVRHCPVVTQGYVALEEACELNLAPFWQLLSSEKLPYWQRLINNLSAVKEEFILYCQEDFILYDRVNTDELERVLKWGGVSGVTCTKLLRSGPDHLSVPLSHRLYQSSAELAAVHQATIWKRSELMKLVDACKPMSVRDFEKNQLASKAMTTLGMQSCFYFHEQSPLRGGHYDSLIFPYTATAVSAGKWNTTEYGQEIQSIAQEYNLALEQRGCI
jgi:hypothetical protein